MLEDLVGRRYKNLELLKNDIEVLSGRKVNTIFERIVDEIYEGVDNPYKDLDYMIDYEFEEMEDVYTLYYLKDNANNYYITEV